ncbi:helix-turn-helix domain-containing protein [Kordia sp. SMS9]|uniref:helix-turn-helix domain-containing protein n=1 Tax=Kordia sp. SMS9 TaxID=2282170 RepID=UPI0013B3A74D|nr:helix-turn-helix domain-containing protein [Kordia sp. SMS9]
MVTHIKGYLNSSNLKEAAGAYITIPNWENKKGNYEEAIALVKKGITLAKEIQNDSILYLGYLREGVFYYEHAENTLALEAYYKAYEIAKAKKNAKRIVYTSTNIALVKIQAYDTDGAIELLLESLEKITKDPTLTNSINKLNLYVNLCVAYIHKEDYKTATVYCNEGILQNKTINDPISQAHLLSAFAEIARYNKEFEKSYQLLDEAEKVIVNVNGKESMEAFLKLYRAKSYYDEKKFQKVVDELLELEKNKEHFTLQILSLQEMYYYLAQAYTALRNSENAMKYYQKGRQIDAESNKKRIALNAKIINKFGHEELKKEIDELEKTSKRNTSLYITGITVLVFVIIGLIFYYKKQQQKNKKRFNAVMLQLEEKRQQEKLRKGQVAMNKKIVATPKRVAENTQKHKKEAVAIDAKTEKILKNLEEFEEKELFLSQDSTLVEVAKKIQTNTTYLSKVINTHKEKSFTAYITDLRVEYAIERLSIDRKFRSFTIGAIAQEIGFKRSESFSKAFKLKTGLYPSYFIKELEKQ